MGVCKKFFADYKSEAIFAKLCFSNKLEKRKSISKTLKTVQKNVLNRGLLNSKRVKNVKTGSIGIEKSLLKKFCRLRI